MDSIQGGGYVRVESLLETRSAGVYAPRTRPSVSIGQKFSKRRTMKLIKFAAMAIALGLVFTTTLPAQSTSTAQEKSTKQKAKTPPPDPSKIPQARGTPPSSLHPPSCTSRASSSRTTRRLPGGTPSTPYSPIPARVPTRSPIWRSALPGKTNPKTQVPAALNGRKMTANLNVSRTPSDFDVFGGGDGALLISTEDPDFVFKG